MSKSISININGSKGKNGIKTISAIKKVQDHNIKRYGLPKGVDKNIRVIIGTEDIKKDIESYYRKNIDPIAKEYNATQKRKDRQINENTLEHISESNFNVAGEMILQIGKSKDYKQPWDLEKIEKESRIMIRELKIISKDIKVINATLHLDESSPHLHVVFAVQGEQTKKNKLGLRNSPCKDSLEMETNLLAYREEVARKCRFSLDTNPKQHGRPNMTTNEWLKQQKEELEKDQQLISNGKTQLRVDKEEINASKIDLTAREEELRVRGDNLDVEVETLSKTQIMDYLEGTDEIVKELIKEPLPDIDLEKARFGNKVHGESELYEEFKEERTRYAKFIITWAEKVKPALAAFKENEILKVINLKLEIEVSKYKNLYQDCRKKLEVSRGNEYNLTEELNFYKLREEEFANTLQGFINKYELSEEEVINLDIRHFAGQEKLIYESNEEHVSTRSKSYSRSK